MGSTHKHNTEMTVEEYLIGCFECQTFPHSFLEAIQRFLDLHGGDCGVIAILRKVLCRIKPFLFSYSIPDPIYPAHLEVRKVSRNGGIRWCHGWFNFRQALSEEYVGAEEINVGVWVVYFVLLLLCRFIEKI